MQCWQITKYPTILNVSVEVLRREKVHQGMTRIYSFVALTVTCMLIQEGKCYTLTLCVAVLSSEPLHPVQLIPPCEFL